MITLTKKDIEDIFTTLNTYKDERFTLGEITGPDNISNFNIYYRNKRVSHRYTVWLSCFDETIRTTIKSEDGRKNINRSASTTAIADRLIYHTVVHIAEKYDVKIYPDYIEGRRILKHLHVEALCYPLIQEHKDESIVATLMYKKYGY